MTKKRIRISHGYAQRKGVVFGTGAYYVMKRFMREEKGPAYSTAAGMASAIDSLIGAWRTDPYVRIVEVKHMYDGGVCLYYRNLSDDGYNYVLFQPGA